MDSESMRRARGPARLPLLAAALALSAAACGPDPGTISVSGRLALSPERLDFGDVPVFSKRTQQLELYNQGGAPLQLIGLSLSIGDGGEGGGFSLGEYAHSIEPAGQLLLDVSFQPERVGVFTAVLAVESGDPERPRIEVQLSGESSVAAALEVEPAELQFGEVCEGGESTASFTIRSVGNAPLELQAIGFSEETPAASFTYLSSTRTPTEIAPGEALTFTLRFSPQPELPDQVSGAAALITNDPLRRNLSVPLHGRPARRPVAKISAPGGMKPGELIPLDGRASYDPGGGSLDYSEFKWSLIEMPRAARPTLTPGDDGTATLRTDRPGRYVAQLAISDSMGCRALPAQRELLVLSDEGLVIELVWQHTEVDLDLHVVPEGERFFGASDCYYGTAASPPDWGAKGDITDDPLFERDSLSCSGNCPERVVLEKPANGRYVAMAHYFHDHAELDPTTQVYMRVYLYGVLQYELGTTLTRRGERWTAFEVLWPPTSGWIVDVTKLDTLTWSAEMGGPR